jgi:16S rRNA G966 N2-methylase RsmD
MRIVAGAWRGRSLVAPPGQGTRPTADRVRQAVFDMLMHAEWGGRSAFEGAVVLDVFAGTGALGLEALSRGAASACFIESDGAALKALRVNIAACRAENRTEVLAGNALSVGGTPGLRNVVPSNGTRRGPARSGHLWRQGAGIRGPDAPGHDDATTPRYGDAATRGHDDAAKGRGGEGGRSGPASLVFLDPPYGLDLVPRALAHLRNLGRIRPDALIVAEIARDETWTLEQPLLAERQHGAARVLVFRGA